jgi:hypothetical protein
LKVRVFQLQFRAEAGGLVPTDPDLHALAQKYAVEHLGEEVDFRKFNHAWVACEIDESWKPIRALGILAMVMRADFTICRFTDNAAVVRLMQRVNDTLHDQYGARGTDVLVHIKKDNTPETQCPNAEEWIKAFELTPADRWLYRVR